MWLITVLTNPGQFFQQRQQDPALRGPAIVVLAVGVLGLLSAVPSLRTVFESVPAEARGLVGVGLVIGALFGLVGPFVGWLLYALAFYAISLAFGGAGEFRDLFALTGWGFLPRVLGAAVSAVVLIVAIGSVPPPETASAMADFQSRLQSNPLVRASNLVGILVTLWSGYIWTHAVATARDLPVRSAAITVAIPLVLSIGWSALGLLGVQLV